MGMSIQDWGAIGEIVGAIGVIGSLLYLAVQIKQSSRSAKANAVQSVQQSMIDIGLAMMSDPSWGEIFEKSQHTFVDLSREDQSRVGWLWFTVMRGTETLYHHYLQGNADESIWRSHEGSVMTNLSNPAFREWWRANTYPFTKEFTELVDERILAVEQSGQEYRWFGNVARSSHDDQ